MDFIKKANVIKQSTRWMKQIELVKNLPGMAYMDYSNWSISSKCKFASPS